MNERKSALAYLTHFNLPVPIDEFLHVIPHSRFSRDLLGMFDVCILLPTIDKLIFLAVSGHNDKSKSIRRHNLTESWRYPKKLDVEFALVTWAIKKRKIVYRFYKLPSLDEV